MNRKTIIIVVAIIVSFVLIGGVIGVLIANNSGSQTGGLFSSLKKEKVKITENETKAIEFETYDNGLVSMQIPKGWKVDVGTGEFDTYMYYTFTAYNPENDQYRLLFSMKTEGYMKTKAMKDWYQKSYYKNSLFAILPYLDPQTTENFYNNCTEGLEYFFGNTMNIPQINNFKTVEKIGTNQNGGDILRATYTDKNGKVVDGVFTATLKEVSLGYVTAISVYDTIFYTAPENEFVEWEDILNKCISTIQFSDAYVTGFYKTQDNMMRTIKANQAIYDEISSMITSGWEARQSTYDTISQKQSDATLGYERVYDTETGDIYKADLGFTDYDWNGKYEPVTDSMYNLPTSGYIEKVD